MISSFQYNFFSLSLSLPSWPSPAKVSEKETRSRDGTPVMKSHTSRQLKPMSLFKSPSTAI